MKNWAWCVAALGLFCGCARHEPPSPLAALDRAYRQGVLTKEEYEAKRAALENGATKSAALEKAWRAGVLTRDEYLAKKALLAPVTAPAFAPDAPPAPAAAAAAVATKPAASAPRSATPAPANLRVQAVYDKTMGNMLASRFLVPRDWKAEGSITWNYRDLYNPVRGHIRAEAPDGSAWYEAYPLEEFFWGDHERGQQPAVSFGAIHYRNIAIQEAMTRYIIGRYRAHAEKLHILGSRPVSNLGKALRQPDFPGAGICVRIRYEIGGQPVDEEFYGLLTPDTRFSFTGPLGTWYEYHRRLALVHSFGAKNGKLEAMRPVLGSIGPSLEVSKEWVQRAQAVSKQMNEEFGRQLKRGFDQIRAAGEMSKQISAQNDRFIEQMDAQRAASNAAAASRRTSGAGSGTNSTASFEQRADDFDQYLRDTEHVVDQWGQVSEVSNQYNYHWTDGWGNFIHSNDANYDPNNYSTQHYEKAKPIW